MATIDQTPPDAISSDENTDYCQCPGGKDVLDNGHTGPSTCAKCLRLVAPANPLIAIANQTVPDKKDVYVAFKGVFGPKLKKQTKKQKLSPALIMKHKHKEAIGRLIDEYGKDAIYESVKGLFSYNAFASDVKAAALFPELFPASPVDGQEREDLEAESETITLEGAIPIRPTEDPSGRDLVDGTTSM